MEISRFPSKRLLRMPGSTTTRGQHVSCDIDTGCVAFCWTENISAPDLSYAAQYLACALPCERFTSALAGSPCITRGRCGSLRLRRDGLPPSASCRSPGAPVHPIRKGSIWPVRRAVGEWPVFARSGRPESTFRGLRIPTGAPRAVPPPPHQPPAHKARAGAPCRAPRVRRARGSSRREGARRGGRSRSPRRGRDGLAGFLNALGGIHRVADQSDLFFERADLADGHLPAVQAGAEVRGDTELALISGHLFAEPVERCEAGADACRNMRLKREAARQDEGSLFDLRNDTVASIVSVLSRAVSEGRAKSIQRSARQGAQESQGKAGGLEKRFACRQEKAVGSPRRPFCLRHVHEHAPPCIGQILDMPS